MVIINVALRYEAVPTPFQLSQQAWIGTNIFTCLLMDRSKAYISGIYLRTSLLQQFSHTMYGKILRSSEVVILKNNTQRVLGRMPFCIVTMILVNSCHVIFVNNQLDELFFLMHAYCYSLHVSDSHVPIIRRINCINTTSGICHSV
jgi:hypothetical protein